MNDATRPHADPPEPGPAMNTVLQRNIAALRDRKTQAERAAGWPDRLADAVTRFAGSMSFVWIHAAIVGGWTLANLGALPGVAPFDPTFVLLATWASVEAIFLSTFILISQNRAAAAADRRADLDVQISLLAEHEITRLLTLCSRIAQRLDIPEANDEATRELEKDVAPEAVLDEIHNAQAQAGEPRA